MIETKRFCKELYKDILNEFIKMPDISIVNGGICSFKGKTISLVFKDTYIQVRRHYNEHYCVTLTDFKLNCDELRNPKFSFNTAKEIYRFCYVFLGFYHTCDEINHL